MSLGLMQHYIEHLMLGFPVVNDPLLAVKNKLDATVAPTVNDDGTQGYSVGSLWIDITHDEAYRCVNSTTGAAVWPKTTLTSDELGDLAFLNRATIISDEAYNVTTWDGVTNVSPSKNAVRDKIYSMDSDIAGKIAKAANVTSIDDAGIADGEIAIFDLTNKKIKTSDITISPSSTPLAASDTTVPTSKAVKDVTDGKAASIHSHAISDVTNASDDQIRMPVVNGNGWAIIAPQELGDERIPWNCNIIGWFMTSNGVSTTSSIQVWKDTWANYPPTVADLILTASITASTKGNGSVTPVAAIKGDMIRWNVLTNDNALKLQLWLVVVKT